MKQLIELGAVRIGDVCANVDFDVLSLPGGGLIAVLLWLYASAAGSVRRANTSGHTCRTTTCGLSLAPCPFRRAL